VGYDRAVTSIFGRAIMTCFAVALAAACSADERVPVVVDLRTDYVPGGDFFAVRSVLARADAASGDDAVDSEDRPAFASDDFIAGRRVGELDAPPGSYVLVVSLLDRLGDVLAERRVAAEVVRTTAFTVLVTRTCASPDGCEPDCREVADCAPPPAACAMAICSEGACLYPAVDGACAGDEYCDADEGCLPRLDPPPPDAGPGCTPSCAGRTCGDDGCGGSCGECASGQSCQDGACIDPAPDCSGLSCGPARNGIGGPDACGTCGAGTVCQGGACACVGFTGACTVGAMECCGGLSCSPTRLTCCRVIGESCGSGADCCDDRACVGGACCVPIRFGCSDDAQCCNGHDCNGGRCCVRPGVGCSMDDQCCSGSCTGGSCV
jgi:hypothetical protein